MVTPLHKILKRELLVNGQTFVLTISPDSLKLNIKGRRKGYEVRWNDLISGDAALAAALNASIGKFQARPPRTPSSIAPSPNGRRAKPQKR